MNFTQIKETCLYFPDLRLAKEFYHGLLGMPIISYELDKHLFFRVGASVLLCFNPSDSRRKISPPAHYVVGKYHFALEVNPTNYQNYKKAIIQNKISIIDTIVWSNGQESFYFNDPVGNVVEILPEGIWE